MDIYKMNLFFKGKIGALALLSSIVLIEPAGAVRLDINDPAQIARIGAAAGVLRKAPPIFEMIERVKTYSENIFPREDVMKDYLSSLSVLAERGADGYQPLQAVSLPFESLKNYLEIEVNESADSKLLEPKRHAKRNALIKFQDELIKFLKTSRVCDYIGDGLIRYEEEEQIQDKEKAAGEADLVWTGSGLCHGIWPHEGVPEWGTEEGAISTIRKISYLFSASEQTYFLNLIDFIENKTPTGSPENLRLASEFILGIQTALDVKKSVFIPEASSNIEAFVHEVYDDSYGELLSYYDNLDQAKKSESQDQPTLPPVLSKSYRAAERNPVLFRMLRNLVDKGFASDKKALSSSLITTVVMCSEIWDYFSPILSIFEDCVSCQDKQEERSKAGKINASSASGQG